jgi:hypothetical protein
MQWLRHFFPQSRKSPSHDEIKEKAHRIQLGTDHSSTSVHIQKNIYNDSLSKLRKQAKIVMSEAKKTSEIIDTAISISIATGGLKI